MPPIDDTGLDGIQIYIWADERLWTVDLEKTNAATKQADCYVYRARAQAGNDAKAWIVSMDYMSHLAHKIDRRNAVAWYCRHFRKNVAALFANSNEHVFLDADAVATFFPPTSGKPADLVEWEIDHLLFESAARVAERSQDVLPSPTDWLIHGRFLKDTAPNAYSALSEFYDLYTNVLKRGMTDSDGCQLWAAGVHALDFLRAEPSRRSRELQPVVEDARPRALSQPVDRFRPIEKIGGGGYADVWRCHDEVLQRDVAVKFLRPYMQGLSTALDHARALARVQHANVVMIHEVAVLPFPGDEFPGTPVDAIVMELLDGQTLENRLAPKSPLLTQQEVRSISGQILDAVEHIHGCGLAHRDLHTRNIVITATAVKVIDILYYTGETIALMGTQSAAQCWREDLLRTAVLVSDLVCFSELRDGMQDGLRRALASADSVSEQRNTLARFLDSAVVVHDGEDDQSAPPQLSKPLEPVELDDIILKVACEIMIETDSRVVMVEQLLPRLPAATLSADVDESLGVMDKDLIDLGLTLNGVDNFAIRQRGLRKYAERFNPKYVRVADQIRQLLGEEKATNNAQLAQLLDAPRIIIDFALERLESEGLCQLVSTIDGGKFVHNISAKLRREARSRQSGRD